MQSGLIRFALIGGACYLVGLALVYLGTGVLGWHYLASQSIALLLVNSLGWVLNRNWTFAASRRHPVEEYFRYFAVNLSSFALTLTIMAGLVSGLAMNYLVASAFTAAIMMVINFFAHRNWSFASKNGPRAGS